MLIQKWNLEMLGLIIKIILSSVQPLIKVLFHQGGLVTPTADFATVLCEEGKQKAKQQGVERAPTYSGMMTFEKAAQEFQYVRFMLNMPIVIGIDL